jgi:hypothetical protein
MAVWGRGQCDAPWRISPVHGLARERGPYPNGRRLRRPDDDNDNNNNVENDDEREGSEHILSQNYRDTRARPSGFNMRVAENSLSTSSGLAVQSMTCCVCVRVDAVGLTVFHSFIHIDI